MLASFSPKGKGSVKLFGEHLSLPEAKHKVNVIHGTWNKTKRISYPTSTIQVQN